MSIPQLNLTQVVQLFGIEGSQEIVKMEAALRVQGMGFALDVETKIFTIIGSSGKQGENLPKILGEGLYKMYKPQVCDAADSSGNQRVKLVALRTIEDRASQDASSLHLSPRQAAKFRDDLINCLQISRYRFEYTVRQLKQLDREQFCAFFGQTGSEAAIFHSLLEPAKMDKLKYLCAQFSAKKIEFLLNQKDSQGQNCLHRACCSDHPAFISFVLALISPEQLEAHFSWQNSSGNTPVFQAFKSEHYRAVLTLLECSQRQAFLKPLLRQQNPGDKCTLMQKICYFGIDELATGLLRLLPPEDRFAMVCLTGWTSGWQPLVLAAKQKHGTTIKSILDLCPQGQDCLSFISVDKVNFVSLLCEKGYYEALPYIHAHLVEHAKDPTAAWVKLLFQPIAGKRRPIDGLAFCREDRSSKESPKSILVWQAIEKLVPAEELEANMVNYMFGCTTLRAGNFILADFLIARYPSLLAFKSDYGNACHDLATPVHALNRPNEEGRVAFFLKWCTALAPLLNTFNKQGQTPLSIAQECGLKQLAKCFVEAGAHPQLAQEITNASTLAHVMAMDGKITFQGQQISLEGKRSFSSLIQAASESLALQTYSNRDWAEAQQATLEALSVFQLPADELAKANLERASKGQLWIQPLILAQNRHAIMSVGSKDGLAIFNRNRLRAVYNLPDGAKVLVDWPPGIVFFALHPSFNLQAVIEAQLGGDYANFILKLIGSGSVSRVLSMQLSPQKVGVCVGSSIKGAILSAMILSHQQKFSGPLSAEMLEKNIMCVRPAYKQWSMHYRLHVLEKLRSEAPQMVTSAVESKILLKYIRKLFKSQFIDFQPMLKNLLPYACYESLAFSDLSEDQKTFFTRISKTHERQKLFIQLIAHNVAALNQQIGNYIAEHRLKSLDKLREFIGILSDAERFAIKPIVANVD